MRNRYHINVFWSDEDDAFIADVPDLKFCSAHGPTPVDAVREVLVAQQLFIESVLEQGHELPEPRYRPAPAAS